MPTGGWTSADACDALDVKTVHRADILRLPHNGKAGLFEVPRLGEVGEVMQKGELVKLVDDDFGEVGVGGNSSVLGSHPHANWPRYDGSSRLSCSCCAICLPQFLAAPLPVLHWVGPKGVYTNGFPLASMRSLCERAKMNHSPPRIFFQSSIPNRTMAGSVRERSTHKPNGHHQVA